MKKRTEIQQDLKRGFGFAPTGIKNLVKWLSVGFMVYVAVRFLCRWCSGWLGRWVAHVGSFGGGVFPHPCRVAHPFRFPFPLRARSSHPCSLRDTLTEY